MILDSVLSLKTDECLLDAVRQASLRKLNADDLLEQRVSFVYGSIGARIGSFTKDQVRQVFIEQHGGVLSK
jgi:predicted transcriptional regulator